MDSNFKKSALNKVKRGAHKAHYDKETIYSILDAADICHVAFNMAGRPMVQPINYGRNGNKLYLHGSYKNRMTAALVETGEVSLAVTHLDAMVLTRSAYHHSVNFRSVIIFGTVRELTNFEEKLLGLESLINHFVPQRWEHCRKPNEKELKATRVLEIEIEQASAKVAVAPPNDNKPDYELDYWAGRIPVKTVCLEPEPDEKLAEGIEIPEHVMAYYNRHK